MLRQSLQQKLQQKLSPQQILLMKLLQVPAIELEQRIKEEIELNPTLEEGRDESADEENYANDKEEEKDETLTEAEEEFDINDYFDDDIPDYRMSASNRSPDEEDKTMPISVGDSFQDKLKKQLQLRASMNEREQELAEYLVGNIDDNGYLRREISSIVNDLAFTQNISTSDEELETILLEIQKLDPAGVGARDLRECLLLQLARKENSFALKLAIEIIKNHFEAFSKKHYSKIEKKIEVDTESMKLAVDEIIKLNPKPGNSLLESSKPTVHVIPDFQVSNIDGQLELTTNSRNAPELKVSASYRTMLKEYASGNKGSEQKQAVKFIKQKLDSAKWFIDAIKQRQETLLYTMNAIMEYQHEYFLEGDETKLKPMILKDIADIVGLDISTISRVVNSKYVQTSFGTFLLKSFFSESLSTDSGEEVSTREVKKILQDSVENEEKKKPLTDEKLAIVLREKGYNIARRTIAKYREQLNIPVARLRKQL